MIKKDFECSIFIYITTHTVLYELPSLVFKPFHPTVEHTFTDIKRNLRLPRNGDKQNVDALKSRMCKVSTGTFSKWGLVILFFFVGIDVTVLFVVDLLLHQLYILYIFTISVSNIFLKYIAFVAADAPN